jgi:hypothetical protein
LKINYRLVQKGQFLGKNGTPKTTDAVISTSFNEMILNFGMINIEFKVQENSFWCLVCDDNIFSMFNDCFVSKIRL